MFDLVEVVARRRKTICLGMILNQFYLILISRYVFVIQTQLTFMYSELITSYILDRKMYFLSFMPTVYEVAYLQKY